MYNITLLSVLLGLLTFSLVTTLFYILAIVLTDFKDFKRADIKKRGWDSLRSGKFWMALAVTAVFSLIGGGISGGISSFISGASSSFSTDINDLSSVTNVEIDYSYLLLFIIAFLFCLLIVMIVAFVVEIFVTNILLVGLYRFFILNLFGRPEFQELFFGFKNGNYTKILKIMFKKTLYTFLWSLLFIIPGIIKAYEYFMVPYILAENPDIDEKTAFRLSKEMMSGNKWRAYVLGISFIGWEILCGFTFGFGLYFLLPYVYATYSVLYEKLRMNISFEDREKYLNNELFGFKAIEVVNSDITNESVEDTASEVSDEVNF